MSEKKFVKYAYFDNPDNKTPTNRDRRINRKSYQEKNNSKGTLIKSMVSYFASMDKPSQKIEQLLKNHPKFFASQCKNPEKDKNDNLNQFLIFNTRKPIQQRQKKSMIEEEEEDDPNWDSNQDEEISLISKRIDQQVIERMKDKLVTVAPKTKDELKRHQKQFLQDYLRSKSKPGQDESKIQQIVKEINVQQKPNLQPPAKIFQLANISGQGGQKKNPLAELALLKSSSSNLQECWIQKVPIDDDSFQYVEDDGLFDNQSKGSADKSIEASSSDEDDAFVDDKPTTIVSNKGLENSKKQAIKQKPQEHSGLVVLSNFTFKSIAQKVGLHPGTCIWVISNSRKDRYKVSTQYMDEVYRQNHLYEYYPFISLNHSQFVHNNDISTQQAFQKFKRFNQRKKQFIEAKENGDNRRMGNNAHRKHLSYKKNEFR